MKDNICPECNGKGYIEYPDCCRVPTCKICKGTGLKEGIYQKLYEHDSYRDFHIPLSEEDITLGEALEIMKHTANDDIEVPLIIRLLENPKFDLPFIDIFHGAVDLYHHDCIHILLGRGMLPKDEAFVIGYTMGSTNKVNLFEKMIFKFFTKHLYPKPWNFNEDDIAILGLGMSLGHHSECHPLDKVDFKSVEDKTLKEIREMIGLNKKELQKIENAYRLEKSMYQDIESQRNLRF